MTAAKKATTPKRRGRRPAGEDTKTALLEAARAVFSEVGYDAATVRTIAARAGVDAAMVNHWFGGKEGLFAKAVLDIPFDMDAVLKALTADGPDHLGENIVRTFLTVWDSAEGEGFVALIRNVTTRPEALHTLRQVLVNRMFAAIAQYAETDRPDFRASLGATQMIGLGMVRYVAQIEPLASSDIETVVTAIAPNLQRYLTGDID